MLQSLDHIHDRRRGRHVDWRAGGFGVTAVVYVAIAGLVLWMAQRMWARREVQEPLASGD